MEFQALFSGIKFILWDWNGTLLDDIQLCLDTVNPMLQRRGHPPLTKEKYRKIFTFPVRNYYQQAGFDLEKESFDTIAEEFIDGYYQNFGLAKLQKGAIRSLNLMKHLGLRQGVLSAMEHQSLLKTLEYHKIHYYFEFVGGITNHNAEGKITEGKILLQKMDLPPGQILLIGDTLHDAEVARQLGIQCLLVSSGHQSEGVLQNGKQIVIPNLLTLIESFSNEN